MPLHPNRKVQLKELTKTFEECEISNTHILYVGEHVANKFVYSSNAYIEYYIYIYSSITYTSN